MNKEVKILDAMTFLKSKAFTDAYHAWVERCKIPKDIILDVGKWYIDGQDNMWLIMKSYANMVDCVGFYNGEWKDKFHKSGLHSMELANMKIIESILVNTAEKKGWETTQVEYNLSNGELWLLTNGGDTIFNGKTGEWAEIKKKPLYTNNYRTEFFEGDRVWHINKRDKSLQFGHTNTFGDLKDNAFFYEIMTERECHRFLDENWDELHK